MPSLQPARSWLGCTAAWVERVVVKHVAQPLRQPGLPELLGLGVDDGVCQQRLLERQVPELYAGRQSRGW